ncbi:hypothetical protein HDU87_007357 [Geranomyces variabilis]|uniref:Uncharacterized protein n=1 Tax=Geranomyces variabilis TaxID=109894 RepID=A0AAD5TGE3_9FUNG|nr:hypothetical protein HDU87_007357 [Geranomyces variabilis]
MPRTSGTATSKHSSEETADTSGNSDTDSKMAPEIPNIALPYEITRRNATRLSAKRLPPGRRQAFWKREGAPRTLVNNPPFKAELWRRARMGWDLGHNPDPRGPRRDPTDRKPDEYCCCASPADYTSVWGVMIQCTSGDKCIGFEWFHPECVLPAKDCLGGDGKARDQYNLSVFEFVYGASTVLTPWVSPRIRPMAPAPLPTIFLPCSLFLNRAEAGSVTVFWHPSDFNSRPTASADQAPVNTTGPKSYRWARFAITGRQSGLLVLAAPNHWPDRVSGPAVSEDVKHALGDSYKLIENSIFSLRLILAKKREASWSIMREMSTRSVQLIKSRLTLLRTRVVEFDGAFKWEVVQLRSADKSDDPEHLWEAVQLRSADIPADWSQMLGVIRLVEMIATVYHHLIQQKDILKEVERQLLQF